jgi:hypothetical protein
MAFENILNKFGIATMEQLSIVEKTFEEIAAVTTERSATAKKGKVLSTLQGLYKVKKAPAQLFTLFLTNHFVFRAVIIRARATISRGYEIKDGDKRGDKLCNELIEASGASDYIRQLYINAEVGGDAWDEKLYSKDGEKILKLVQIHPATFGFTTDRFDNIILDNENNPTSYTQLIVNEFGQEETKEVPIEKVEHLKFITVGDELVGTSAIQPVYNTAVRLMNMEDAAAHAAVKTANPTWIGKSKSRSPRDLLKWNKILGRISAKEQIMLPDGMELEMKSPGKQLFSDYSEYYLDAVVSSLGVPRGVLLGSSEGSNRSSSLVLSKHFNEDIRANQKTVEKYFNKIFKEYGEIANFKPPKFYFNDTAENAEANYQSALELFAAGLIDQKEARIMIGLEGVTSTMIKDEKKSNKKAYFPAEPGSPEGSQKNIKKRQKKDVNVPSVK